MELREYIKKCGESANRKGWKVTWENLSEFLILTIHELTDGYDKGMRDDNREKMQEEIGDCLIRLFHIIHDLEIPIEEILKRLMEENERRPYLHGHKRL